MVHIRRMLAALAALSVAGAIFAIAAVLYNDQNPPAPAAHENLLYVWTYNNKYCGHWDGTHVNGRPVGQLVPCHATPSATNPAR